MKQGVLGCLVVEDGHRTVEGRAMVGDVSEGSWRRKYVRIQALRTVGTRLDCGGLQHPAPEFGFYAVAEKTEGYKRLIEMVPVTVLCPAWCQAPYRHPIESSQYPAE